MAESVTTKTLARVLNISERRVQQLKKEGMPGSRNKWPLFPALHWYLDFLRSGQPVGTAADERRRLEKAKADMAELDIEERRRELIKIKAVQDDIRKVFAALRQELLGLPGRLAAQLAAVSSPRKVKAIVNEEVRSALNRAVDIFNNNYDCSEPIITSGDGNATCATKTECVRVGGGK